MRKIAILFGIWIGGSLFILAGSGCSAAKTHTPVPVQMKELSLEEQLLQRLPLRSSEDFGLVFTSSVQGSVKPCGCTDYPLGGLSRLASVIKSLRAHYGAHLLFVDTGDLLFEKSETRPLVEQCQDQARIELLLSTFKDLGVIQTVQGPKDIAAGTKAYVDWMEAYQIHTAQEAIVTTLQKVGEREVAFLALLPQENMTHEERQSKLDAVLGLLKAQKVSHVIVLSQLAYSELSALRWDVHPVDAILQGHEPGEAPIKPKRLGEKGPYVLFNGIQGQYLGVLHFSWPKGETQTTPKVDLSFFDVASERKILETRLEGLKKRLEQNPVASQKEFLQERMASAAGALKVLETKNPRLPPGATLRFFSWTLGPEIAPAPEVKRVVDEYEAQIPILVSKCEKGIQCQEPEEEAPVYVGVQMCANCHQAAVEQWRVAMHEKKGVSKKEIGHARAWLTLEEKSKTRDRQCVGCHSVGFNQPGGYCKTDEVGFLADVQCEACHGPGSLHSMSGDPNWIDREVPESHCRTCHHVPHIPSYESFTYREKLKTVLGPGHGEKKWRELTGNAGIPHGPSNP